MHADVIASTVEFTVLRMEDCVLAEGVETEYPPGSLSEEPPENPWQFVKLVNVNG